MSVLLIAKFGYKKTRNGFLVLECELKVYSAARASVISAIILLE